MFDIRLEAKMDASRSIALALLLATAAAAHADVAADYRRCAGKLTPSEREAACSAVLAEASAKTWQEKAHNARGHARMALGRYGDAIADFTEAIRLDPIAGYYDNRQAAYRAMGELDSALSDAYAAVKIAPKDSFVYRSRGLVYADMRQWPLAIDDFNTAIAIAPGDAGLYVERGKVLIGADKPQRAIEDFSRALAIDPEMIDAYKYRGEALRRTGQTAAAIDDLAKYQLVHPNDVETAAALAALRGAPR